jgi:hypothetical protein
MTDDHSAANDDKPEPKEAKARVSFFDMAEESNGFSSSMNKMIAEFIAKSAGERIPAANHQVFSHGRQWTHPAHENAIPGVMQEHSAEMVMPFADIVGGDFKLVHRLVLQMVKAFNDSMARMLYETLGAACEQSGQIVDGRDKPFPEAFLEGFKKIEFGVDRDGKVSMPEIHVGNPDMIKQLEAAPPEFQAEVERVKAEKIAKALEVEADRKKKFKSDKAS